MCQPASMIVTKTKVYWSKNTESHHEIIEEFNLKEQDVRGNYTLVPVEIIPPNNDYKLLLSEWNFSVDFVGHKRDLPSWWDEKKAEKRVRLELKKWRKAKIVMPNEKVESIKSEQKVAIYGTVESIWGGIVKYIGGKIPVRITGNPTIITYSALSPEILKSSQAVLIDRTKDPVVCYVGKGDRAGN